MSTSRDEILARIRGALATAPAATVAAGSYGRTLDLDHAGLVTLFTGRIADYDVTVRTTSENRLSDAIAERCAAHGVRRLGAPADLPAAWRPPGVEVVLDDGLESAELDALDGSLTGSFLAIAETGTIVLDCGPYQGRRALTLVPDLHICVVFAAAIVGTVPEAFARIAVDRPVTMISGPSATSDIELRRVRGVHGPRRLDVIVVQR